MKKYQSSLYRYFVKPRSGDRDSQRREYILNVLLLGLLGIATIALADAVIIFCTPPYYAHSDNFLSVLTFWFVTAALVIVSRMGHWRAASVALVLFLTAAATFFCTLWGIGLAVAQLLFGLTIVIAGVLFSAVAALLCTVCIGMIILLLHMLQEHGYMAPSVDWQAYAYTLDDAVAYIIIFIIIATVTWLWNRETDDSLKRARASEAELQKERDNLEIAVAHRTHELKELQASRLLEMQPLAELGRIGASLIHDMSSPLTTASLQLELLGKTKQSQSLKVVHQNIDVLGKYLIAARMQLQHASTESFFSVSQELKQVMHLLRHRARQMDVVMHVGALPGQKIFGDPVKLHKIVANLVANALDASEQTKRKEVFVKVTIEENQLELTVRDYGIGIPNSLLPHLFEPFFSTKKLSDVRGLGIGLAMVKQYVEQDFGGHIKVSSSRQEGTIFRIIIPIKGKRL